MKTAMAKIMLSKVKRRLTILLAALALAFSCTPESGEPTGGETHFLTRCEPSTNTCGDRLTCVCGVCTLALCGARRVSTLCRRRSACLAASADECAGRLRSLLRDRRGLHRRLASPSLRAGRVSRGLAGERWRGWRGGAR